MHKLDELMTRAYIAVKTKKLGQGTVEYAGALVIAAIIVGAVITVGQTQMENVFNKVMGGIQTCVSNHTPTYVSPKSFLHLIVLHDCCRGGFPLQHFLIRG